MPVYEGNRNELHAQLNATIGSLSTGHRVIGHGPGIPTAERAQSWGVGRLWNFRAQVIHNLANNLSMGSVVEHHDGPHLSNAAPGRVLLRSATAAPESPAPGKNIEHHLAAAPQKRLRYPSRCFLGRSNIAVLETPEL